MMHFIGILCGGRFFAVIASDWYILKSMGIHSLASCCLSSIYGGCCCSYTSGPLRKTNYCHLLFVFCKLTMHGIANKFSLISLDFIVSAFPLVEEGSKGNATGLFYFVSVLNIPFIILEAVVALV